MNPFHLILALTALLGAVLLIRRFLRGAGGRIPPERLAELRTRGAVIVDVRTAEEFARGNAPGSLNIPLDALAERLGELDRSKPVLLCCASGARSSWALRLLQREGFTDAHNAGAWRKLC